LSTLAVKSRFGGYLALETDEEIIAAFMEFFKNYTDENSEYIYLDQISSMIKDGERSIVIDYEDLQLMDVTHELELTSTLVEYPVHTINMAQKALEMHVKEENYAYFNEIKRERSNFHCRFMHVPTRTPLRYIRSQDVGRIKAIEGVVVRVSEIKPIIVEAHFICKLNREHEWTISQRDSNYTPPSMCIESTCRGKEFELSVEDSKLIDWQAVTIQERPEELPPGTSPRSMKCRLIDDLVDQVRPGDRVQLVGIVRTNNTKPLKKGNPLMYDIWIDTNYIEPADKETNLAEITTEEEADFLELADNPKVYDLIINSLAPQIKGMTREKEAVMLFLFSGVDKSFQNGFKTRGQPNIMLLGDPGVAKSQILKSVHRIAPRGIYTSGKGSSAAGLTAAISRDPDTAEITLEAGAMVLADQGICAIDEFDKMNENDRSAIHEAMEQGTVSIAKAGIVATLNSRTGVLAAANPKYGRYEDHRPFMENVDLSPAILSRFDLIFVLRDIPDATEDSEKAMHILNLHLNYGSATNEEPPLSMDLLRKYIAYAKQKSYPILTQEAINEIHEFYVTLRSAYTSSGNAEGANTVTITARQLEGIVRLAEARARVRLSSSVTKTDAKSAIDLIKYSLEQVAIDPETGKLDYDAFASGITSKKRNRLNILLGVIDSIHKESAGESFTDAIVITEGESEGLSLDFIKSAISDLVRQGTLYRPEPGKLRKLN
jgi:replicative DNA helicase Mcm